MRGDCRMSFKSAGWSTRELVSNGNLRCLHETEFVVDVLISTCELCKWKHNIKAFCSKLYSYLVYLASNNNFALSFKFRLPQYITKHLIDAIIICICKVNYLASSCVTIMLIEHKIL